MCVRRIGLARWMAKATQLNGTSCRVQGLMLLMFCRSVQAGKGKEGSSKVWRHTSTAATPWPGPELNSGSGTGGKHPGKESHVPASLGRHAIVRHSSARCLGQTDGWQRCFTALK